MGSRCYSCGEKFGRCYEHAGNCPESCTFFRHDCPGGGDDWDGYGTNDIIREVHVVPAPPDVDW